MANLEDRILGMDFLRMPSQIALALVLSRRKNSLDVGPLTEVEKRNDFRKLCGDCGMWTHTYPSSNVIVENGDGGEYLNILTWHEDSVLPEDFMGSVMKRSPNFSEDESVNQRRKKIEDFIYRRGVFFGYPECCAKEFAERGHIINSTRRHFIDVLLLHEKRNPTDELVAAVHTPCSAYCEATIASGNGAFLKKEFPKLFRRYKRAFLKAARYDRDSYIQRLFAFPKA